MSHAVYRIGVCKIFEYHCTCVEEFAVFFFFKIMLKQASE